MKVCEESTKAGFDVTSQPRYFLKELFSRLDEEAVLYCVLRNYEGLPEHVENDIDVLVHPQHVVLFRECLLLAAKDGGWILVKNPLRFAWEQFWFKSELTSQFVEIDIVTALHWKGVPWASTEWILNNRRRYKQFFVPCVADEAGILLIKDVIQIGRIKAKYLSKLEETLRTEQPAFRQSLVWFVGRRIGTWLFETAQRREWQAIEQGGLKIRLAAVGKALCRNPFNVLSSFGRFLWGHLRAWLGKNSGMFIVFIGPDGSGKTTVADKLVEHLKPLFRHRKHFHGRFGVLPRLRFFRNLVIGMVRRKPAEETAGNAECTQNHRPHSLPRVLINVVYYGLDFLLGHWIIQKTQANGHLIIFDRYFYDWFFQSYLERTPRWTLPILMFVFPRPDLVVYLYNSPEVIHQRKPELTIDEIEKQSQKCQQIVQHMPYGIIVSTNGPVEKVVQQIAEKIEEIMVGRFQGSLQ